MTVLGLALGIGLGQISAFMVISTVRYYTQLRIDSKLIASVRQLTDEVKSNQLQLPFTKGNA
jgi:hypothetical protein